LARHATARSYGKKEQRWAFVSYENGGVAFPDSPTPLPLLAKVYLLHNSAFLILSIALVGCAAAPPPRRVSITTPFSDADFQPWAGTGNASIRGQAFLKTVGGDVKTCAGQQVVLIPDNAYSREMISAASINRGDPPNLDGRVNLYARREICDAQGGFSFENVKPNKWIALSRVTWGAPSQYSVNQQGGTMEKRIDAHPGENRLILSDTDYIAP
jgi:hypothetical protein